MPVAEYGLMRQKNFNILNILIIIYIKKTPSNEGVFVFQTIIKIYVSKSISRVLC